MARFKASAPKANGAKSSGKSLGALAASLLISSSSTLPALAALPMVQHSQGAALLSAETGLLLAESESEDKKKKKKQKQSQSSGQTNKKNQQNQQQHQSRPHANKVTDDAAKDKQQKDKQQDKKKYSERQREKIYEEGRKDGMKTGREKGYEKGYDEGKKKGKDRGYERGYDKGLDKGKNKGYRKAQRQEWQSWNSNQWKQYNKSRKNIWITPVQYNRPWGGYPMWAQSPNWGYSRPWGGGWYNSGYSNWSWWGGQALGWGINALTTALIVNNAVNNAIRDRQTTVVVPNSSMKLYYGSVEARDRTEVTFVATNGSYTYEMEADCEDGLLNGEVPTSLSEAELVNAACQVAFGSV
jgi:hypothetical protein